MSMLNLVVLLSVFGMCHGQLVKQCMCSSFEPCMAKHERAVTPCVDACANNMQGSGANYAAVKRCVMSNEPMIRAAFSCIQNSNRGACSNEGEKMVPKRYTETLKIAAMNEISNMANRMGITAQIQPLLGLAKKMTNCVQKCMEKAAGYCYKNLDCGLALPSDTVLIQNAKQCAMRSGFNTPAARQLCQCVAGAGMASMASACPKINIA